MSQTSSISFRVWNNSRPSVTFFPLRARAVTTFSASPHHRHHFSSISRQQQQQQQQQQRWRRRERLSPTFHTFQKDRKQKQKEMSTMASSRIQNPTLFVCDVQEKFRSAIWEFPKVISTAKKMVKAATILNIPIYSTTQNAARLGPTVSELKELIPSGSLECDKTAFSMMVPELAQAVKSSPSSLSSSSSPSSTSTSKPDSGSHSRTVLIVGIETHICVTQTALDLLAQGHRVYVLADGVSSCNRDERPVALARLRAEGCTVTTSESVLFELLGDAAHKDFKAVSGLVKETKDETKSAVETFCRL